MALTAESDVPARSAADHARPRQQSDLATTLRRIAGVTGRSPAAILGDFVRCAFGPGKLSFDEFVAYGLYDPARHPGCDMRSFAGLKAMEAIWLRANFRTDLYGLLSNKVASCALLAANGFPVIPLAALYSERSAFPGARTLTGRDALAAFLRQPRNLPLFGKPIDAQQSLGSMSFASYDAATDALIDAGGAPQPLQNVVDEIALHYAGGYLLQPLQLPHPQTQAICGPRLATVRVLTLHQGGKARILRACEKLPGGNNAADNFWRKGNLLVPLDLTSGERGQAVSGTGLELREHSHHPDSGAAIAGTRVPNWAAVQELALTGAALFDKVALLGWDIAPVENGAVIVEVNVTPDLALPQLADRRGILDGAFEAFLAERKGAEVANKRQVRTEMLSQHRQSFQG